MDEQKRRYLTIKVSTEMYQVNPEYLSTTQRTVVEKKVQTMAMIQRLILASDEACKVEPVGDAELEKALNECVEHFSSASVFHQVMQAQSLTMEGLRQALHDQLRCDKILEAIVAEIPPLDITKAQRYYQQHQQEFSRATTWEVSQILITINEDYVENTRQNAFARIQDILEQMKSKSFERLAQRYSECPSAMNHGYLGWCEAGKLYVPITTALSELSPQQVSQPIETEIGFHLVKYHQKKDAAMATFAEVWPFLQEKHKLRAKEYLQRQWIQQLMGQARVPQM